MPRAKFYVLHGPYQLRVEKIGPDLWHCAIYDPSTQAWVRLTALTEKNAKSDIVQKVNKKWRPGEEPPEGEWMDDSDQSDENWIRELAALNFPGYLDRLGIEKYPDLPVFAKFPNLGLDLEGEK